MKTKILSPITELCWRLLEQNIDFSEISFLKHFNYKYLNSIIPQHKFKLIHHIDRIKINNEFIYSIDSVNFSFIRLSNLITS